MEKKLDNEIETDFFQGLILTPNRQAPLSKLLKRGYIGDYIGDYYRRYEGGY